MRTYNINEAKAHLSRLIEMAVKGEPFVIAKAGRSMVMVTAIDPKPIRRIGFMVGEIGIPDDFDRMGQADIEAMFGSKT